MKRSPSPGGFVLLVVLAAAAVLSMIAAFIYSRTENQLILSVASRGQSLAAARATMAAERKLAIYRANYPLSLGSLTPAIDYPTAILNGQTSDREFQNLDRATYPSLELGNGGGAVWCTESWLLNRGLNVPPWTVVEAFGFYGYTDPALAPAFVNCLAQGNLRMATSHITVYLETPAGPAGGNPACPACGTGAVGGS